MVVVINTTLAYRYSDLNFGKRRLSIFPLPASLMAILVLPSIYFMFKSNQLLCMLPREIFIALCGGIDR